MKRLDQRYHYYGTISSINDLEPLDPIGPAKESSPPLPRNIRARPTLQPHELASARSCSSNKGPLDIEAECGASTTGPNGKAYAGAMKALQNRIVLLELQNQQLRAESQEFEHEKARLNGRTVEEMARAAELEKKCSADLEQREGAERSLRAEVEALREENREARGKIQRLERENEESKQEARRLDREKERHLDQNAVEREDGRKHRRELEETASRLEIVEKQREEARQRVRELIGIIGSMKQTYKKEIGEIRTQLEEYREGMHKLRVQYGTDIAISKAVLRAVLMRG